MVEDSELLRRYVEDGSEVAFALLVQRRVDLVYSVALRQVGGDAHLAHDVTQKVFSALARKAAALKERPVLTGWLHQSARYAAADLVRSERRRRQREEAHALMQETETPAETAVDWDQLRPLLDHALDSLKESERDAVALRFFESKSYPEIATYLHLQEDTVRKRVDRALDKLQGFFAQRGIRSTSTAAIAMALTQQAGMAAPTTLAASITGTALAAAAATTGMGVLSFFAASKLAWMVGGSVVAISVSATYYAVREPQRAAPGPTQLALGPSSQEKAQPSAISPGVPASPAPAVSASTTATQITVTSAPPGTTVASLATTPRSATAGTLATRSTSPQLTRDDIRQVQTAAKEKARRGQFAEALDDFLWLYDEGMVSVPGFSGVRQSFLLSDIRGLFNDYAPARLALEERRNFREKRLLAGETDSILALELAALNHTLGDARRNRDLHDQLPVTDRRRRAFASYLFDDLVKERRYQEALVGIPYELMLSEFKMTQEQRISTLDFPNAREFRRRMIVQRFGPKIEALAGAGHLDQARELIEQVLSLDGTTATRSALHKHLQQAGQPGLLALTRP
ncbi:MAG TPA: sigma-70 family RNA polymerase sigma factor [Opitutaceae bacterium]|nr:sigma-70 family RNA polymerase sigma factor [Opitutaceae bacterium]